MRILENTNIDFVGGRKRAYIISGTMVLISLLSIAFRGLDLGIDFTGGREYVVQTAQSLNSGEVRQALEATLGSGLEVKTYGGAELLIRTGATELPQDEQIEQVLNQTFEGAGANVVSNNLVGPRFAQDLQEDAYLSIFFSLLVVFLYIFIRFKDWRYGFGAVLALMHDVVIAVGAFSLLQGIVPFSLTVDQTIIAAFMTICGFSVNDTVVVFDRIRESVAIYKNQPLGEIMNKSINAMLGRTVITAGTVLLTTLVLFIFGGDVLRGFAFALFIGVGVGVYSSIFVASPVVLEFGRKSQSVGELRTAAR